MTVIHFSRCLILALSNLLCRIVTTANTTTFSQHSWEESAGLLSALIPHTPSSSAGSKKINDAASFNESKGSLKLGPPPVDENLTNEAERALKERAMNGTITAEDLQLLRPTLPKDLVAPQAADMPPLPSTFKTADIKREVERVRDARKRMRLDPSVLNPEKDGNTQGSNIKARALPSICTYTLYDVGDG